jgi:hypothetical protein
MEEQLEYNLDTPKQEPKYLNRAEWCFQFFDNEAVPFAYSKEDGSKDPLYLELHPVEGDTISFNYKGMVFKIFSREMSEESKQKLADENKNKETTPERNDS